MNPNPSQAIWVELKTRITTQRLHYRSGDEDTAAQSIYKLFQKCRDLMTDSSPATLFEKAALNMLNDTIRPYTARWHGWMTPDPAEKDEKGNSVRKLNDPQVRRKFRTELRELQPKLRAFETVFDLLRQGKNAEAETILNDLDKHVAVIMAEMEKAEVGVDLGDGHDLTIQDQVKAFAEFPGALSWSDIQKKEQEYIQARRALRAPGTPPNEAVKNAAGLALSGGGIKSATFCLGVVQELVKRGLFQQMDYLSTVSGGGYLGSFISSYLGSKEDTNTNIADRAKNTFAESDKGETAPVRHLRNHSKYLLHGGFSGILRMAGLMLSGIMANLLMLLPVPLGIALLLWGLNQFGSGYWGKTWLLEGVYLPPWCSPAGWVLSVAGLAFFLCWLALPIVQRRTAKEEVDAPKSKLRGFWEGAVLVLALILGLAGLLYLIPVGVKGYLAVKAWLPTKLHGFAFTEKTMAAVFAGVPIVLATLGRWFKTPWIKGLFMKAFILSGPVFYAFVVFFVSIKLGLGETDRQGDWPVLAVLGAFAFFGLWSLFGVNLNMLSPHRYYRARLSECYLAVPDKEKTLVTALKKRLSTLGESKASPYHLINAFVNLPASQNRELRGRGGDFFLFSRDHCGSPATGYVSTERLETADPRLDLMTAVAISAAAGSSNMGWRTEGPFAQFRFLLAVLNVRLGYWIPNYQKATFENKGGNKVPGKIPSGFVASPYLLRESTGNIDETLNHLNVSDGGHIENLGVYELLRRKCRFIISADGGAVLDVTGGDLQRLERYAFIDLGIRMQYDLRDLKPDERGVCRAPAILVKITYSDGSEGWMIYLRPSITGNESNYVLDHWKLTPGFPYESIADQIFEEEQFEGYRSLGQTAIGSLFNKELGTNRNDLDVKTWFSKLAANLLPDNENQ